MSVGVTPQHSWVSTIQSYATTNLQRTVHITHHLQGERVSLSAVSPATPVPGSISCPSPPFVIGSSKEALCRRSAMCPLLDCFKNSSLPCSMDRHYLDRAVQKSPCLKTTTTDQSIFKTGSRGVGQDHHDECRTYSLFTCIHTLPADKTNNDEVHNINP